MQIYRMRSRIIFCLMVVLIVTLATAGSSWSDISYFAGTVQEVSRENILVDGQRFELATRIRVQKHVREYREAGINEKRGKFSDVVVGSRVTMKLSSGVVVEIIVEQYR